LIADFNRRAGELKPDFPSGELYEKCRRFSEASVWLERLWDFLFSKVALRAGNGAAKDLLHAADEVVWSCYRPVIKRLPPGHPAIARATAPLVFLEPEYSPAAVQYDRPLPPGLRLVSGDPVLDRCLEHLPLPTVRLPPWCVEAPWWLVLIGHEVGHHIQHELDLVGHFASGVGQAVRDGGCSDDDARCWEKWGEEIFADSFSVFTMGPWAVRAITELEWSRESVMVQRRTQYPAPAIRLALMTSLTKRLGLETNGLQDAGFWGNMAEQNLVISQDLKAVENVVDFVLRPIPGTNATLQELCGFEVAFFSQGKTVESWSEQLRGMGQPSPTRETRSARNMACAAFAAWTTLGAEANPYDGERLNALAELTVRTIRDCAEPGMRAGGVKRLATPAAEKIALQLFESSFELQQAHGMDH
jgi:hypothetical protein